MASPAVPQPSKEQSNLEDQADGRTICRRSAARVVLLDGELEFSHRPDRGDVARGRVLLAACMRYYADILDTDIV
jgi:hypothetical protein